MPHQEEQKNEEIANYFMQTGDYHCLKCHKEFKDAKHALDCPFEVKHCGRLENKECEFSPPEQQNKNWEERLDELLEAHINGEDTRQQFGDEVKALFRQTFSLSKDFLLGYAEDLKYRISAIDASYQGEDYRKGFNETKYAAGKLVEDFVNVIRKKQK